MKLTLMFTGSENILKRCRQCRYDVMELVSTVIEKEDYGTTLEYLRVNVVFQDAGMIKLRANLSRESKSMSVDVELSKKWVENADNAGIKLALLRCLVKAVEITKQRLTKRDDDFDADRLSADLREAIDSLQGGKEKHK